jgi:hypothetical protein
MVLPTNFPQQQDAMFALASEQDVDVTVVMNSDLFLFDDFIDAFTHLHEHLPDFFMVGARYDVDFNINAATLEDPDWQSKLRSRGFYSGVLHSFGGVDYYVWRPRRRDPYSDAIGKPIPPFTYARSKADNWIVQVAVNSNKVHAVDASTSVVVLHPKHDYHHLKAAIPSPAPHSKHSRKRLQKSPANIWTTHRNDDVNVNIHLAFTYGNFKNQQGTPIFTPWRLNTCYDRHGAFLCLQKRARTGICNCEHSSAGLSSQHDPAIKDGYIVCGTVSNTNANSVEVSFFFRDSISVDLLSDAKNKMKEGFVRVEK